MKTIRILGTGCPKCKKPAENAGAAARAFGARYGRSWRRCPALFVKDEEE